MRQVKKVKIKNIIPRKERRLINIDKSLRNFDPILVEKIGKRWFKIIDGHHRYYKLLELNKRVAEVMIKNG